MNLLPAPAIHAAALRVFDQTFVVTELLKLLILGIAFVGIGSAFMVLGLARRGELQTLQSLGLSPRHCRRLLVWQGRDWDCSPRCWRCRWAMALPGY